MPLVLPVLVLAALALPLWDPLLDWRRPAIPPCPEHRDAAPTAVGGVQAAGHPRSCGGPEYRAFDFWVGEWEVTRAGRRAGTNAITRILDDCVIHEEWTGAGPSRGRSFTLYDRATRQWVQTWVDNQGLLLSLRGGLTGGAMVMEGSRKGPAGEALRDRITWTPQADGTVRQLWQTSTDNGTAWQVQFDGLYRRRAP